MFEYQYEIDAPHADWEAMQAWLEDRASTWGHLESFDAGMDCDTLAVFSTRSPVEHPLDELRAAFPQITRIEPL